MDAPSNGNTREFYRIRYPDSYRPKIRIQDEDYDNETVELSEQGGRFSYKGPGELSEGLDIEMNITFYDGEFFHLKGEILRIRKEDVIIRFSERIPIYRLINEQLYIKYIASPLTGDTRQFHRIRYPLACRPKIRIQGVDCDYEVVELSERGIRFLYRGPARLRVKMEIEVNITFHDLESYQFKGEILRIEKEDIIVRFSGSLTTNRVMKEQLFIRTHVVRHI
jgi:hypothetical protein